MSSGLVCIVIELINIVVLRQDLSEAVITNGEAAIR